MEDVRVRVLSSEKEEQACFTFKGHQVTEAGQAVFVCTVVY